MYKLFLEMGHTVGCYKRTRKKKVANTTTARLGVSLGLAILKRVLGFPAERQVQANGGLESADSSFNNRREYLSEWSVVVRCRVRQRPGRDGASESIKETVARGQVVVLGPCQMAPMITDRVASCEECK